MGRFRLDSGCFGGQKRYTNTLSELLEGTVISQTDVQIRFLPAVPRESDAFAPCKQAPIPRTLPFLSDELVSVFSQRQRRENYGIQACTCSPSVIFLLGGPVEASQTHPHSSLLRWGETARSVEKGLPGFQMNHLNCVAHHPRSYSFSE